LCDRYVRGVDNLATLKLLVGAVRAVDTAVAFDVWTADQDAEFGLIKSITGTQPSTNHRKSLPSLMTSHGV
jgi:hypothetical protein